MLEEINHLVHVELVTKQLSHFWSVASSVMEHWGTCPLEFANARKFCRPNARWLLLLDNIVTTNFKTRAPHSHDSMEQNSGETTSFDDNFQAVKILLEQLLYLLSMFTCTAKSGSAFRPVSWCRAVRHFATAADRCVYMSGTWCQNSGLFVSILLELIHVYLQLLWITVLWVAASVKLLQ